ncbi:MAG: transcription-repair coupling factor [Myxococcales bacterium]|nr:transcription-repair coupling factor [Myxococcales bacterium]
MSSSLFSIVKALRSPRADGPRPGALLVSGDPGPRAYALASLLSRVGRPVVIVTPSDESADALAQMLGSFLDEPDSLIRLAATDVSPWKAASPSRGTEQDRLTALWRLTRPWSLVVTSVPALCRRAVPPALLVDRTVVLRPGLEVERETLELALDSAGYTRSPVVDDPGSYAVRGSLLDVFPIGAEEPVRLDFFGDVIETIRAFEVDSQRSQPGKLGEVLVPPCREVLLSPESWRRAKDLIRVQGGECGVPAVRLRAILGELESGVRPLGHEGWAPAFTDLVPIASAYLSGRPGEPPPLWVVVEPATVTRATNELLALAEVEHREAVAAGRLVFPVEALLTPLVLAPELVIDSIALDDAKIPIQVPFSAPGHEELRRAVAARRGDDHAFEPVAAQIARWRRAGKAVVAVAATRGHASRLEGVLGHYALKVKTLGGPIPLHALDGLVSDDADLFIFEGELLHGFEAPGAPLVVLGTEDILPHQRRLERRVKPPKVKEQLLQGFRELSAGSLVVHADYGIGRYEGLVHLVLEGVAQDFLKLIYSGDHVLYVPVYKLDRVQRYSAGEEAPPPLDKLGAKTWEKTKARAKKSAEDMAAELVAVQAERKARPRTPYSSRDDYLAEFEAAFPYDETPDQLRAIEEVMADMDAACPMDRLVCGDVGFGKTEVAIRAAFRAAYDQKQVAVLVPTTVLAEQHGRSFITRFAGYPLTVAVLSRFRSGTEEADILEKLAKGQIDIVIGTHRLLSKDVVFKDLGLLVIDEEHRFGVKHKERLKQLKALVDVLTLTATPIPRTLNMAISGLRDMSVISTPPSDRLAVRTLVTRISDDVIQEAIELELGRGGQVYVVHNQVETIGALADRVQRLVPTARILVGHGQMPEATLEKVMLAFIAGEADILVSTTIIESGLDISNANTMIIHRADRLGLAQLYQLRGRVGRSSRRAYCHLLVAEPEALDVTAKKRIEAMQRYSELGSGFAIATMDMEIRGAGNLIGASQSGHVKDVGLDLFTELLFEAVQRISTVEYVPPPPKCEMKVAVSAFLPEDYVPDERERLVFYKRVASAASSAELEDVFADLADRAGRLPPEAVMLRELTALKLECEKIAIKSFAYTEAAISVQLAPESPLAGAPALRLAQRRDSRWRLTPTELIRAVSPLEWQRGLPAAFEAVRELLRFAEKFGGVG